MTLFGTVITVVLVAMGLLVGSFLASSLLLAYLAIAVAAVALLLLVVGTVVLRERIFGSAAKPAAAVADEPAGTGVADSAVDAKADRGATAADPEPPIAATGSDETASKVAVANPAPPAQPARSFPAQSSSSVPAAPAPAPAPAAAPAAAAVAPVAAAVAASAPASQQPPAPGAPTPGKAAAVIPAPRDVRETSAAALRPVAALAVPAGTETAVPDASPAPEPASDPDDDSAAQAGAPPDADSGQRPDPAADGSTADGSTAAGGTVEGSTAAGSTGMSAGSGLIADSLSGELPVMIDPGVARYHRSGCILIRFLSPAELELLPRAAAKAKGCMPCKSCLPDSVPKEAAVS